MPARRPALDERPDGDAVSVPVASQVGPEEGHVVYLASLERNSSHFLLIEEQNVLHQKIINKSKPRVRICECASGPEDTALKCAVEGAVCYAI